MGNIENFSGKFKIGLILWVFSTRDKGVCVAVEKLIAVKLITRTAFCNLVNCRSRAAKDFRWQLYVINCTTYGYE